jgi:hypothetical protein
MASLSSSLITPISIPLYKFNNIKNIYKKITFNFRNSIKIILTPTKLIHVFEDPLMKINDFIVILYNLRYEYKDNRYMEANIPYYLSDGGTNEFRANMIYPFSCFNIPNTSCPYSARLTIGGILKHKIGKNIIIKNLTEKVVDLAKKHDYSIYNFSQDEQKTMIHKINSNLYKISKDTTRELGSVLGRIENILDFFISISSMDRQTISDARFYRPVYFSNVNRYNINHKDNENNYLRLYKQITKDNEISRAHESLKNSVTRQNDILKFLSESNANEHKLQRELEIQKELKKIIGESTIDLNIFKHINNVLNKKSNINSQDLDDDIDKYLTINNLKKAGYSVDALKRQNRKYEIELIVKDVYRKSLISVLLDEYKKLESLTSVDNILNMVDISLSTTYMKMSDFNNNIGNLCGNYESLKNIQRYMIISNELFKYLKSNRTIYNGSNGIFDGLLAQTSEIVARNPDDNSDINVEKINSWLDKYNKDWSASCQDASGASGAGASIRQGASGAGASIRQGAGVSDAGIVSGAGASIRQGAGVSGAGIVSGAGASIRQSAMRPLGGIRRRNDFF